MPRCAKRALFGKRNRKIYKTPTRKIKLKIKKVQKTSNQKYLPIDKLKLNADLKEFQEILLESLM